MNNAFRNTVLSLFQSSSNDQLKLTCLFSNTLSQHNPITLPLGGIMRRPSTILLLAVALLVATATSFAQLTGTKTIPGDYATIAAAIADLNTNGVGSGGVTFNVASGYTETITATLSLTATGTAANPITFQKSGGGANPLITAYTGGTGTPATAVQDGIWQLVGSDYVTIDGIDLQDNPANVANPETMEFGYALYKASETNGSQNVTIRNCTITLNRVNNILGSGPAVDGSRGINVVNAIPTAATTNLTITDAAGSNSNNKFYSNTIQNCNIGVALIGFADVTPFTFADQGNDVGGASLATGNTIRNYGGGGTTSPAAAVRTLAQYGVNISYNTINNNDGAGVNHATTLRGIYTNTATSASGTINNNAITLKGGGTTTAWTAIENVAGSTAAGNTITINNNTITGDYLTATTGLLYGIFNSATPATVNIQNNTVTGINYSGLALTGTGVVYGIFNSGAATNVNIRGNTVSNIARLGTTGGTTIGIYASNGANQTVKQNTVNNLSIDGTGTTSTMYGIQTSTGTIVVDSNIVTNLNVIKTTGTSALYGIYNIASPTNENYNYNQVYNITHSGTGTTYGIYAFTTTGVRTVSNNLVHTLSTGGTTIAGINQSSSSPSIFKNKIYNLQSNSTGAPTVAGIGLTSVGTAGSAKIYNNLIGDLKAPNASTSAATAPTLRGINITSTTATSTVEISYNTVYLNGSSTGTNFGTTALWATTSATATSAALTLRNNIFVNTSTAAGTGFTSAYQRSSTALANYTDASNNNLFYAGTPGAANLIFFDGTNADQTLADFKTRVAPKEAASVSENPAFLSTTGADATFLHMNTTIPTQIESGGIPVAGITDDFDGDTRNVTTPDIGADEFAGIGIDLSPPAIAYSPLLNTSSLTARTLTATITDVSGVPTAGIGLPVLYWRINSGSYAAATATSLGSNQYQFSFGGGVAQGDTVRYYVVAQDNATTPNVGAFPSAGAGGFTANPPAAATPPTNPSSYLIVQPPLAAGDYTVGLTLFEKAVGKKFTTETFTRRVMREVPVGPEIDHKANGGNEQTSLMTPYTQTELREVEETYSVLMENGLPYAGPTRVLLDNAQRAGLGLSAEVLAVYPTITAAVNDLNLRGVSGSIRFLLVDAAYPTETFPITISVVSDSVPTASKTVTIKPSTGVNATVSGASAAGPIFRILGTNYITIDGSNTVGGTTRNLTIENTSITTPQVVLFASVGTTPITNGTLKNTVIINGVVTSSAVVISDGATAGNPGYFNNMLVQNNHIRKAYIGVYSNGGTAPQGGTNLTYENNSLAATETDSIRYVGLYMQGVNGATVRGNLMSSFSGVSNEDDKGMWLASGTTNAVVERNTIRDLVYYGTGGYGGHGIYVSTGLSPANVAVINNMISNLAGDGWSHTSIPTDNTIGIVFTGTQTALGAYYNSIHLFGNRLNQTGALSMGIYLGAGSVADIRNNIIVNKLGLLAATGYGATGIYAVTSNAQFSAINYNNYVTDAAAPTLNIIGKIGTSDYTTLATWAAASGGDANSINSNVNFVAPTDLHIVTTAPSPVDSAATPIAGITNDFDGQLRNATHPDIGADEFTYVAPTPPVVSSIARSTRVPAAGDTVVVTCTITDVVGIASANLIYNVNGAPNSVPMALTGGTPLNGTYRGVVPGSANQDGNRIELQIEANSSSSLTTTTPIAAARSYYAGISTLSLTGPRRMHPNGRVMDSLYYARVTGTVNGPNFQTTNLGYHFQDAQGGIQLFGFGILIPPLNLGDSIIVTGRIAQFRGLTEIIPDTQSVDIQVVATGRTVTPITVTVPDFQANPELYESRLLRMTSLNRRDATPPWPAAGGSANIVMYQGVVTDTIIMRIDSDTQLPGTPEPAYPTNVTGVVSQFSSATSVYNNGYQTQPRYLTDFTSSTPGLAGTYTIGTGGNYANLKAFFDAINADSVAGNITGNIISDVTETATAVLNAVHYVNGGPWTITIRPSGGARTVSGGIAGPLVDLDGAANVVFNGDIGSVKSLTLRNTTSGTTAAVVRMINNANNNSIMNCILEGAGTSVLTGGVIAFSTSATDTIGNSNNTISNNNIRDVSTTGSRPSAGISSNGTATARNRNNTISNNNIFNFVTNGVNVSATGNGPGWVVSGNSFYYNSDTIPTAAQTALNFNPGLLAGNHWIYGNYVGGSAPMAGGSPWTNNGNVQIAGIFVTVDTTSQSTIIRKNTVRNIVKAGTGAGGVFPIALINGSAIVDSNTIGGQIVLSQPVVVPIPAIRPATNTELNRSGTMAAGVEFDIPSEHTFASASPEEGYTNDGPSVPTVPFVVNGPWSIINGGTGVTTGIQNQAAGVVAIRHNEVSHMLNTWIGSTSGARGINNGGTAASRTTVANNVVHDIDSYTTGTLTTPAAGGITWFPASFTGPGNGATGNVVYAISARDSGTVASNAMGILVTNNTASVTRNLIYDVRNASTGTTATAPPTATGIYMRAQSASLIANNMVSIGSDQSSNTVFSAFWNGSGTLNTGFLYHNSGLVAGAASGGSLGSWSFLRGNHTATSVFTNWTLRNNIFVNTRTGGSGKHYAIGNQGTRPDSMWLSTTSDYNVFNSASAATIGLWGTDDQTLAQWQATSTGDAMTVEGDPGFISNTDLHIDPASQLPSNNGTPIAEVLDDFDGDTRSATTPDRGADEYTALPPGPLLFENFESGVFPPAGWSTYIAAGDSGWRSSTVAPFSPVTHAFNRYQPAGTMGSKFLVTKRLNIPSAANTYEITFWARRVFTSPFPPDTVYVKLSTTDSLPASFGPAIYKCYTGLLADTATDPNIYGLNYRKFKATFTGIAGPLFVAFDHQDNDGQTIYLDDVTVQEAGPTTPVHDIGVEAVASASLRPSNASGPSSLESARGTVNEKELDEVALESMRKSIEIVPVPESFNSNNAVSFRAFIRNYGQFVENSYQVGWTIDGAAQTAVTNTRPLEIGGRDTLNLTWATPTPGQHVLRAFTILATDTIRTNDTATFNFSVAPPDVVFEEGFNNPIPPYPTGWHVKNLDGGGTTTWFQGNPAVFPAFEGSGYIGANYNAANSFYIDEWLVTPNTGGLGEMENVDSLIFWQRSPSGQVPPNFWPDSIQIRVSTTDTAAASFTLVLDYFQVDTIGWRRKAYALPNAANRYIAFRYLIYNGGVSGSNSNYLGIDAVQIKRTTGPGFFDDFESYTVGQQLVVQNPVDWSTWSGPAGTAEDPFISSAQAFSGTKSVVIVTNNDLVKRLGNDTSGVHEISFRFFVPNGKAGYFNTLNTWPATANAHWAMEVYFDSTGNGRLFGGSATAFPFTYTRNTWQEAKVVVNLTIDSARFVLNGNTISTWRWTAGIGLAGAKRLAANDFFGATAWDQMYMDDYRYRLGSWTGVEEQPEQGIPETFALMQNYPNPFNPTTTIQYALPTASTVSLKIYNILGQEVATLVDQVQTAGYHTAMWNGRNQYGSQVATGVYFYRIEAKGADGAAPFTNLKKMLLVK